jgi:hypothetical protein
MAPDPGSGSAKLNPGVTLTNINISVPVRNFLYVGLAFVIVTLGEENMYE